jgi:hypothetical protein
VPEEEKVVVVVRHGYCKRNPFRNSERGLWTVLELDEIRSRFGEEQARTHKDFIVVQATGA